MWGCACQAVVLLVRFHGWQSECWLVHLCQETHKANLFVRRSPARKMAEVLPERRSSKTLWNILDNFECSVIFKSFEQKIEID